jgi:hypothetical protein
MLAENIDSAMAKLQEKDFHRDKWLLCLGCGHMTIITARQCGGLSRHTIRPRDKPRAGATAVALVSALAIRSPD